MANESESDDELNDLLDSLDDSTDKVEIQSIQKSEPKVDTSVDSLSVDQVYDIKKYLDRFDVEWDSILTGINGDRARIDNLAQVLFERVDAGTATSAEVESLVKIYGIMTDTHGHKVKLIDSMSKIMASARQSVATIINNNVSSSDSENDELKKLLKARDTVEEA